MQQDQLPLREVGEVKDVAKAAEAACRNANDMKSATPNIDY